MKQNIVAKIRIWLIRLVRILSNPDTWTNLPKNIINFFRREGDYLFVYGRKIHISNYVPYVPIVLIILFISLGYVAQGGVARIMGTQFIVWSEAAVASTIDSMDEYTPLVKGKDTQFYKIVKKELDKPTPALTTGATIYLGPQSTSRLGSESVRTAERQKVIEYKVQNSDTLSGIAAKFGLKIETLKWANDIEDIDNIRPGQVLKIPPVDGVLYTIEEGDTLLAVVQYYGGDFDRTLEVNAIADAGTIFVGQKVIIAGGSVNETPAPDVADEQYYDNYGTSGLTLPQGSFPNNFPYGWCTWYVASRRYVPWNGNAGDWYYNAQAMGYATGSQPAVGAVLVTNESWWGHVAIVEAVYGSTILISEMNGVAGWGVVGSRVVPAGSGMYIY